MTGPPAEAPDLTRFREMMARWATGVSIVTSRADGRDSGLTVNAFLSVSLSPPVVLISLSSDAETLPVIRQSGIFAVNVLSAVQREVSELFARRIPAEQKFARLPVHRGTTGTALLDGALAAFECRLQREVAERDHLLLLGDVTRLESGPDSAPLLFFRRRYAEVEPDGRLRLPPLDRG